MSNDQVGQRDIPSAFEIMVPCSPAQFGDFMSGLLGKPQTIEKVIRGEFELNKDDVISTFHLVHQRLQQQNNGTLVQFTVRIIYDDDSSVLLNSLPDFEHYAEIRPISSLGVVLSWTYLIKFRGKDVPEKQEINLSFQGTRNDFATGLYEDGFLVHRMRAWVPAGILIRINHTERTWGVDIESLLTGHVRTFLKKESTYKQFIRKHSGIIGLTVGCLFWLGSLIGVYVASGRFIDAYLEKLRGLSQSSSNALELKIDFLTNLISTGVWPRFTFAAIAFLVVSFLAAILFGFWVDAKADKQPQSFVLLSRASEDRRREKLKGIRRDWVMFYVSIFASILTGLISNTIFAKYFGSL